MDGYQITAEIVITYNVDDEGKLVALRAYWAVDRAAATAATPYRLEQVDERRVIERR